MDGWSAVGYEGSLSRFGSGFSSHIGWIVRSVTHRNAVMGAFSVSPYEIRLVLVRTHSNSTDVRAKIIAKIHLNAKEVFVCKKANDYSCCLPLPEGTLRSHMQYQILQPEKSFSLAIWIHTTTDGNNSQISIKLQPSHNLREGTKHHSIWCSLKPVQGFFPVGSLDALQSLSRHSHFFKSKNSIEFMHVIVIVFIGIRSPQFAADFFYQGEEALGSPVRQKKAACLPSNYPQTTTSLHWTVYLERCPPFLETSSNTTITQTKLFHSVENTKTTWIPLEIIIGKAKNITNMQPMLFHRIPVNRLEQHWATPCCIIYSCTIKNYRSLVSDTAERNKYLDTYHIWSI